MIGLGVPSERRLIHLFGGRDLTSTFNNLFFFFLTSAFVSRNSYLIQGQDAAVFTGLPRSTTL